MSLSKSSPKERVKDVTEPTSMFSSSSISLSQTGLKVVKSGSDINTTTIGKGVGKKDVFRQKQHEKDENLIELFGEDVDDDPVNDDDRDKPFMHGSNVLSCESENLEIEISRGQDKYLGSSNLELLSSDEE